MRADDDQGQQRRGGARPAVITDFEDFTKLALSSVQVDEVVGDSGQCVFNWTTRAGYPVGVVMA